MEYQTIAGFGSAFTDAVGLNLNSLPADLADNIIKQYYSPSEGKEYIILKYMTCYTCNEVLKSANIEYISFKI